jgi:hypothetical protein
MVVPAKKRGGAALKQGKPNPNPKSLVAEPESTTAPAKQRAGG